MKGPSTDASSEPRCASRSLTPVSRLVKVGWRSRAGRREDALAPLPSRGALAHGGAPRRPALSRIPLKD